MVNFKLEAPWYTYQKKVKALFEQDPDIIVEEIRELSEGKTDYAFDIEVRDHEKFVALDRVMPEVVEFGNVTLGITLYDEENSNVVDSGIEIFATIFKDNPLVEEIVDAEDFTGTHHGFVAFKPQIVQFFDDDISDYNGNWSGLAQDIAREIFGSEMRGVHFCTAPVEDEEAEDIDACDGESSHGGVFGPNVVCSPCNSGSCNGAGEHSSDSAHSSSGSQDA